MKWLFSVSMAVMPWLMVALMSWIYPDMTRGSIFFIVGVLFSMALWPMLFMLAPVLWGAEIKKTMLLAETNIAIERAKHGLPPQVAKQVI
jgi:hypothetical protein